MDNLTSHQLEQLHNHLLRVGSSDDLTGELLDHLACQIEEVMAQGVTFEQAMATALDDANGQAVRELRETYQRAIAMTDEQLQQASLDDIVFEFRHKSYGAYQLRQAYPHTLRSSLLLSLVVLIVLMSFLHGFNNQFPLPSGGWLMSLSALGAAGIWWLQIYKKRNKTLAV